MDELTRTPAMIAGEINTIKEQVRNTAVMASVEIGRRLKEAKGLVPEGQWTEWLQGSVNYGLRTAQNLMALATEFDEGHGAALEGMSYTKAVLLLGVPRWDREEFIAENDVERMSTRELKQTIADLQDRLAGRQIDMEETMAEQDAEEARRLAEENESLKARITDMQKEIMEGSRAGEGFKKEINLLKDKLTTERTESTKATLKAGEEKKRLQEELAEAQSRVNALEAELQEAQTPMIQQVTPPEVEEELKRLRAQAARSREEADVRSGYDLLKTAYNALMEKLKALAETDGAMAKVYGGAFAKGLRMMADQTEG